MSERNPDDAEAFRMYLRWTARLSNHEAARAILDARFQASPVSIGELLLFARGCDELKMFEMADTAFEEALRLDPSQEATLLNYVRSLEARGSRQRAIEVLEASHGSVSARENVVRARVRINLDLHYLSSMRTSNLSEHSGNAVLRNILETISARRSHIETGHLSFIGSILMINGSLGSGGAERQLTNTAVGLKSAIENSQRLNGRDIIGPLAVCVRSLSSRPGADFFQPALTKMNIATFEYSGLEVYGGNRRITGQRNRRHGSLSATANGRRYRTLDRSYCRATARRRAYLARRYNLCGCIGGVACKCSPDRAQRPHRATD